MYSFPHSPTSSGHIEADLNQGLRNIKNGLLDGSADLGSLNFDAAKLRNPGRGGERILTF
jgi:hypothetical protein